MTLGLYLSIANTAFAEQCPPARGVAVQVLGSGGPIADDARASSGYLLWHNGRSIALVDISGGAVLRFAEAGASFEELDAVLLTHLHADHSAGLPALLKSGYFTDRKRSLLLAGPGAGGNARVHFPALEDYLAALLKPASGAYGYLGGYLDGSGGMPYLRLVTIDSEPAAARANGASDDEFAVTSITLPDSDLSVTAIAVSHGIVPAVAYRLEVDGRAVVFSGDQDGTAGTLGAFAAGVDLLVLHMPIPERAGAAAVALHARPSRLGEIAAEADAKQLLLSHFMRRSLANLDANVEAVTASYRGPVSIAEDLACVLLE